MDSDFKKNISRLSRGLGPVGKGGFGWCFTPTPPILPTHAGHISPSTLRGYRYMISKGSPSVGGWVAKKTRGEDKFLPSLTTVKFFLVPIHLHF